MARIMGIDYGTKRTGIAVTDPLQIIVTNLATIETPLLTTWLDNYLCEEEVNLFVVGEPLHHDGNPAKIHPHVIGFVRQLEKKYPQIGVVLWDERNTSVNARQIIRQSGARKSKRRDKSLIDKVSAALILQDYMEQEVW